MTIKHNDVSANRIVIYTGLILLLILGVWLRGQFVQTVQLYPDEFVTLLAVKMINQTGLPIMPSGLFYEHGLFFSYLGSLASTLGPAREWVRYLSLLFGSLTILLTFWLGRRWFSPWVGLIAVAGLVVAPAAIEWSGRARMYALLQFLVLLALWLAFEGVSKNKAGLRWLALLTYLLATLTHFVAVSLAPPLVVALLVVWWLGRGKAATARGGTEPGTLRITVIELVLELVAFVAILGIAFLVKRAGQPKGIEALDAGVAPAVTGVAQVFSIYSNFSFNFLAGWSAIDSFYLTLPALIFVPFALVTMLHARVRIMKTATATSTPRLPASSYPHLFASTFLSLVLLFTTLEMILIVSPDRRDDKYLFMLLPVLFLLGAQGMVLVGSRLLKTLNLNSPYLPISASLLIILLIILITWPRAQARLANTGDDYDSAFAYVQQHWQDGDTILTGTPPAAAFYLDRNDFYSVQRRGGYDYRILNVDGQPVDRWLASPAIRTQADLHRTLANNDVWLVLERWGLQKEYYDLPFQQQLLAQTDYVTEAQGVFILRSKPNPQPISLEPANTIEANFSNQVQLLGYTVEPDRPVPGQPLRITFYWKVLAPIPLDYTVFVHLRHSDGSNVAQADHLPLGSLYPTSLWPVGETIRETSELFLPADLSRGSYDLWVGLYLLETGERLPLQNDTSAENAVKLGEISVGQ